MTQQTKKKPKTKRVIALLTAVVMGFMIAAFSACDNFECILQQQVNAVSVEVYAVQKDDYATIADIDALLAELAELRGEIKNFDGENTALLTRIEGYEVQLKALRGQIEKASLSDYKKNAIQALDDYANALGKDNFTTENWDRILDYVYEGIKDINSAVDKAGVGVVLVAAKERIGRVLEGEWGISPCGRFALSISVEEATLPQGQPFVVNVIFKNITDADIVIFYNRLFSPLINGSHIITVPITAPRRILFRANSIFSRECEEFPIVSSPIHDDWDMWLIGSEIFWAECGFFGPVAVFGGRALEIGRHELRFDAIGGIRSNTVVLTVV